MNIQLTSPQAHGLAKPADKIKQQAEVIPRMTASISNDVYFGTTPHTLTPINHQEIDPTLTPELITALQQCDEAVFKMTEGLKPDEVGVETLKQRFKAEGFNIIDNQLSGFFLKKLGNTGMMGRKKTMFLRPDSVPQEKFYTLVHEITHGVHNRAGLLSINLFDILSSRISPDDFEKASYIRDADKKEAALKPLLKKARPKILKKIKYHLLSERIAYYNEWQLRQYHQNWMAPAIIGSSELYQPIIDRINDTLKP